MSKKAMIAGVAGLLICLVAGVASILWIQSDFIQLPILGIITGIGACLIYSMGRAVSGSVEEPIQGVPETTEPHPVQDSSHQSTFQEPSPKSDIENHGIIVRTANKDGRTVYIEFADGYALGTLPSPEDDESKRDRYGALKV